MIGHAIDLQHFVPVLLNDTCDISIQFFTPFFLDQRLPILNGKNGLDMDLCICIRHKYFLHFVPDGTNKLAFTFLFYPHVVPNGTLLAEGSINHRIAILYSQPIASESFLIKIVPNTRSKNKVPFILLRTIL